MLLIFSNLVMAQENNEDFSVRCERIEVNSEISLPENGTSEQLFLVNNISRYLVILVGVSPSIITGDSQIEQNQWSAFATSDKQAAFICIEQTRRGSEQRVPCSLAVKICSYQNTSFANKNTLDQWIVENKTLPELLDALEQAQIDLSSPQNNNNPQRNN